jgi:S1-C subfamily serine protease
MKRVLVSLTAALLLVASTLFSAPAPSIVPLQSAGGSNFCTTWSINAQKHYYATAAHCLGENAPTPHLFGQRVKVVLDDEKADVAVVQGPVGSPALKLSKDAPQIGDQIHVTGFPYGFPKVMTFKGLFAHPGMDIYEKDQDGEKHYAGTYALFDMTAAPGNSGSPVMNKDGKVVSLLQVGWQARITGGIVYSELVRVLEPYVEVK